MWIHKLLRKITSDIDDDDDDDNNNNNNNNNEPNSHEYDDSFGPPIPKTPSSSPSSFSQPPQTPNSRGRIWTPIALPSPLINGLSRTAVVHGLSQDASVSHLTHPMRELSVSQRATDTRIDFGPRQLGLWRLNLLSLTPDGNHLLIGAQSRIQVHSTTDHGLGLVNPSPKEVLDARPLTEDEEDAIDDPDEGALFRGLEFNQLKSGLLGGLPIAVTVDIGGSATIHWLLDSASPDQDGLRTQLGQGARAEGSIVTSMPPYVCTVADQAWGIDFTPNHGLLAISANSHCISVWDLHKTHPEAEPTYFCEGHEYNIPCVALSPDGSTLASASIDGSIGIWKLGSNPKPTMSLAVTPQDGSWMWSVLWFSRSDLDQVSSDDPKLATPALSRAVRAMGHEQYGDKLVIEPAIGRFMFLPGDFDEVTGTLSVVTMFMPANSPDRAGSNDAVTDNISDSDSESEEARMFDARENSENSENSESEDDGSDEEDEDASIMGELSVSGTSYSEHPEVSAVGIGSTGATSVLASHYDTTSTTTTTTTSTTTTATSTSRDPPVTSPASRPRSKKRKSAHLASVPSSSSSSSSSTSPAQGLAPWVSLASSSQRSIVASPHWTVKHEGPAPLFLSSADEATDIGSSHILLAGSFTNLYAIHPGRGKVLAALCPVFPQRVFHPGLAEIDRLSLIKPLPGLSAVVVASQASQFFAIVRLVMNVDTRVLSLIPDSITPTPNAANVNRPFAICGMDVKKIGPGLVRVFVLLTNSSLRVYDIVESPSNKALSVTLLDPACASL